MHGSMAISYWPNNLYKIINNLINFCNMYASKRVGRNLISVKQYALIQFVPFCYFMQYFGKLPIFRKFKYYFHINKIYEDKI